MNFFQKILGLLLFRNGAIKEVVDSDELTRKAWLLLLFSSIVSGIAISYNYFAVVKSVLSFSSFVFVLIPTLFCFFYGIQIGWCTFAYKKHIPLFTKKFFIFDIREVFSDKDFRIIIRIIGFTSPILILSSFFLLIDDVFYLEVPNASNAALSGYNPTFDFLLRFFFAFVMFLNPLNNPITILLVWQAICFIIIYYKVRKGRTHYVQVKKYIEYGKESITEVPERETITGVVIGILMFNLFWTIVLILLFASIIANSRSWYF